MTPEQKEYLLSVLKGHGISFKNGGFIAGKKPIQNSGILKVFEGESVDIEKYGGIGSFVAEIVRDEKKILQDLGDLQRLILNEIYYYYDTETKGEFFFFRKNTQNLELYGPIDRKPKSTLDTHTLFTAMDSLRPDLSSIFTRIHVTFKMLSQFSVGVSPISREEILSPPQVEWSPALFEDHQLSAIPVLMSNDIDEPCFICRPRLPPSPDSWEDLPYWSQFLSRLNKPDQFLCFLAAITDAKNFGRQALYLFGKGGDGKSSVIKAISEYFGSSFVGVLPADISASNRFVMSGLYNKKLLINADCKNPQIIKSGIIHKITGNDSIAVEAKFQTPFLMTNPGYKLIFASNVRPELTHLNRDASRHETSRLIIIDVGDRPNQMSQDSNFEKGLIEEMPKLLGIAVATHNRLVPSGDYTIPDDLSGWAGKEKIDLIKAVTKSAETLPIRGAKTDQVINAIGRNHFDQVYEIAEGKYSLRKGILDENSNP
jgi:hypothetical protein